MRKRIKCEDCDGTGKIEVVACDRCGEYPAGKVEDEDLCQNCWAKTLSDEEINNL